MKTIISNEAAAVKPMAPKMEDYQGHSPNPWAVQSLEDEHNGYDNWRTFAVRCAQNVCLAVVGAVDRYGSESNESNAHLMAAAPELLAACLAVRDGWEKNLTEAIKLVNAAIAKATRETRETP